MINSKHIWGRLAALAAGTLLSVSASAVMFSLNPADQIAGTGDTVTLDLVVSDLFDGGPDSLGDWDIDIAYDSNVLDLDFFDFGSSLGDEGLGEVLNLDGGGPGLLNLAQVSLLFDFELDALQSDSFVLASLEFDVLDLEPGNRTVVSIDNVLSAGDAFGIQFATVDTANAVIRNPGVPNGVPEPATLLLTLAGLGAVGGRRLRKSA